MTKEKSPTRETPGTLLSSDPSRPFGISADLNGFSGNVYATGQLLVEQTAYALGSHIFSYASDAFPLDDGIKTWIAHKQVNASGSVPTLTEMETRAGAGAALLGFLSAASDPQGSGITPVLATSAAFGYMQAALTRYVAQSDAFVSRLALNVAAVGYDASRGLLTSDYATPASVARATGVALVASRGFEEAQDMALFAAFLSAVGTPAAHVYDGQSFLRATACVPGVASAEEVAARLGKLVAAADVPSEGSRGQKVKSCLAVLNAELGTHYKPFEYVGHRNAETVIVVFGSAEAALATSVARKLAAAGRKVGAINVRVYEPFLDFEFLAVLPAAAKRLVVLGQLPPGVAGGAAGHSALFADVSTALFMARGFGSAVPKVEEVPYTADRVWAASDFAEAFAEPSVAAGIPIPSEILTSAANTYAFWDLDASRTANAAARLAHTLSLDNTQSVAFSAIFDNFAQAGAVRSEIRVSEKPHSSHLAVPAVSEAADVTLVAARELLDVFDVVKYAAPNSLLLLAGVSRSVEPAELPVAFRRAVAQKNIRLFVLDWEAVGDHPETAGRTENLATQIAFWKLAYPGLADSILPRLVTANGNDTEVLAAVLSTLVDRVADAGLAEVPVAPEWAEEAEEAENVAEGENEEAEEARPLPPAAAPSAFHPNEKAVPESEPVAVASVSSAAKALTFREAYGVRSALRPDLPVKNFVVKVKENKRVTPEYYDRNIFQIEFDVSGTGLKYAIGEALGVHGRNNSELVREFLSAYGLDENELVAVPSRDDPEVLETRTVLQVFCENLELFGKPPKRFYESLAAFATDSEEKAHLDKLVSPAGAEELKKRNEELCDTYSDVLLEFTSARPSLAELVTLIAPLKRREYSIASSQRVHPNEVHLLIVVVDWVDGRGRKRFGHCSKYLSDLPVGSELVVSVKPSVMKLPPLPSQPVIMAGLGTGLAPFKAFVEERALQKAEGHEIGKMYLFLGSRHQKEEYLYGELWEAYKDAGVLTHIGAAFSRDQPHKIYIQDRIRESMHELVDAFVGQKGGFYLCGPTWPVPDVTQVLCEILEEEAGRTGAKIDANREIEELKEAGRYVLEVY